MGKYGNVALRATYLVKNGTTASPVDAWDRAAREAFRDSASGQMKGCPRNTFLGLCEEGVVDGVPAAAYTTSIENKSYALEAVRLLTADSVLEKAGAAALWKRVMNGREKKPNSQMDVVLALWSEGLIRKR